MRTINPILEAANDPEGATDWWLQGNGWLGATPAQLIGNRADQSSVAGAHSEAWAPHMVRGRLSGLKGRCRGRCATACGRL